MVDHVALTLAGLVFLAVVQLVALVVDGLAVATPGDGLILLFVLFGLALALGVYRLFREVPI